jgi:hypothetical protein
MKKFPGKCLTIGWKVSYSYGVGRENRKQTTRTGESKMKPAINQKWIVEYLRSSTLGSVYPVKVCRNQEHAEEIAGNFNRSNQDRTWNSIEAYASLVLA